MRPFFFLLVFAPFPTIAQHCGFDHRSIIVVRPVAAGDSTVIEGLRITLLDSTNLPFVSDGRPWDFFHRNTDPATCDGHTWGRYRGAPCCFPFAADNYVLVIPNGLKVEGMKMLVQDERDDGPLNKGRDRWPVRYRQQVVTLTANDSYRLCGTYDSTIYPTMHGRPNFAAVVVNLHPR